MQLAYFVKLQRGVTITNKEKARPRKIQTMTIQKKNFSDEQKMLDPTQKKG
jgi:hypothetical protein